MNGPWALDVDVQGNVYVTAYIGHSVHKAAPDGTVTEILE